VEAHHAETNRLERWASLTLNPSTLDSQRSTLRAIRAAETKRRKSMSPSLSPKANGYAKSLVVAVLSLWFLVALGGSLLGEFDSRQSPPNALAVAAILPVIAFAIAYSTWKVFRQVVPATNLRLLTLAQTWRIGGVLFLILYSRSILPGVFALPAGWGDMTIGATAPLVAWAISSKKHFPKQIFILWNVLGMLDLVMAVSLGILASASPLGIFAGGITTQTMGRFPLSLIPTFFVPFLFILHLIALSRYRHENVGRESPTNPSFLGRHLEQSLNT
jgi:hypothetical protein